MKLSPVNIHDIDTAFDFIDEVPARAKNFLADKGYDSDLFRKSLIGRGLTPVIPGRKNRIKEVVYDKAKYKTRHVVENAFCNLKQFRSIATRYEKLSTRYLSMVQIGCILLWAKL